MIGELASCPDRDTDHLQGANLIRRAFGEVIDRFQKVRKSFHILFEPTDRPVSAGRSPGIDPENAIIGMEGKRRRTTSRNSKPAIRGISRSQIMTLGSSSRSFTEPFDSVSGLPCLETCQYQIRRKKLSHGRVVIHQQNAVGSNFAHTGSFAVRFPISQTLK